MEKAKDNEQQKLEDESLEWYVSGDGMWVNQYLRGNGDFGELSEQEKSMLDAIDKATKSEIVKENVLYRSVDASAAFGDITDTQYENIYNALKYNDEYAKKQTDRLLDNALNKEFTEKGFMSTTKSEEFAKEFADFTGSEKPMVIKYNVPEGIKGKDLAKFDIEGDEQYEVLLAKDQKYKITSFTAKDGNIIAEADLISSEKVIENSENSATIKATKTISGHSGTPKQSDPNDIIDHLSEDGSVDARGFYNEDGMKSKDIHTNDHGNPKWHDYGEHGEHGHDYEWNEDGSLKNKTTRDITDEERKDNGDIL